MGRMYTASVGAVAVTAAQDFFELVAPSDAVVVIHSIYIGQYTDAGDSEAEMLPVQINRNTASGSGGSALTARPHEVGDAAFGGTVEANNTTQAGGTETVLVQEAFNIQAGWFYKPTPEERIVLSPSGQIVVELPVAPTDSITMQGSITFEEIGG